MDRAYSKSRDVVKVYEGRTNVFVSDVQSPVCQGLYSSFGLPEFNDMYNNLRSPIAGGYEVKIDELKSNIVQFDQINTNLERTSCP